MARLHLQEDDLDGGGLMDEYRMSTYVYLCCFVIIIVVTFYVATGPASCTPSCYKGVVYGS